MAFTLFTAHAGSNYCWMCLCMCICMHIWSLWFLQMSTALYWATVQLQSNVKRVSICIRFCCSPSACRLKPARCTAQPFCVLWWVLVSSKHWSVFLEPRAKNPTHFTAWCSNEPSTSCRSVMSSLGKVGARAGLKTPPSFPQMSRLCWALSLLMMPLIWLTLHSAVSTSTRLSDSGEPSGNWISNSRSPSISLQAAPNDLSGRSWNRVQPGDRPALVCLMSLMDWLTVVGNKAGWGREGVNLPVQIQLRGSIVELLPNVEVWPCNILWSDAFHAALTFVDVTCTNLSNSETLGEIDKDHAGNVSFP